MTLLVVSKETTSSPKIPTTNRHRYFLTNSFVSIVYFSFRSCFAFARYSVHRDPSSFHERMSVK